ncbi:MAG: peptidase S41 [Flavisolibacter sp.]|nr:peptidase S41 [Flavisolibacter sp.]
MKNIFISVVLFSLLCSCAVSHPFNTAHKYSPQELQADYDLFRNILEAEHPGLYWYTSKDSIDYYFERGKRQLQDSLTETDFRNILSYVTAKIRCGHTTVQASKAFARQIGHQRPRLFPLSIKIWDDTAVVTANLNRRDTNIIRGVVLTSIDNKPLQEVRDSLFQFLSADGYNLTHKYQTLSNRGVFNNLYRNVYGFKPMYQVGFIDTLGQSRTARLSLFVPPKDTSKSTVQQAPHKPSRREQKHLTLKAIRSVRTDTVLQAAVIDLNSFTKDSKLRGFFKQTFRQLKQNGIQHVIIDLRGNGGGSVINSNLLTKYIASQPFKIADSLYALRRNSPYGRYQQYRIWNWLFLVLMTRRKEDKHYHFRFFEGKYFKPKKKNHYQGQVYVLTGGNTFSASTLFVQAVKEQDNVTIIGEETGGGAYGNNAWLIPDVTLPHTKIRFRLPLFRLVVDKNAPKGRGIFPEVEASPTVEAIRRNTDYKLEKAIELIRKDNGRNVYRK